ncbi:NAD-dependent epimerase/dehydratase family protein [Arthrobacter bambusae]|uniref:NAD-dependent epimerase/dehydratase family protein n=1 Tax=Arthrobacter bambusae TaxID=1338426 RepID=UPI002789C89B|nr:NAD-dependent epimerase/dehydratase family protein [Arthrobacter bambusae]MDQ0212052.1 nucleoside-diphosphate-sugar epimerase [Arthrobacter bambusae]MDQ0236717.1 nucleoside-diphosphate-sugar epimerase [Arthrobacter bambusae]
MKIVVTGAAGFVGGNLCRELLRHDEFEVWGIDALTDYYTPEMKRLTVESLTHPRFKFIHADLATEPLSEIFNNAVAVFHQAGQPGVRKSWGESFGTYTRQNVDVTQRLLEESKKTSTLKAFVYASSSSIYGNATRYPTSETDLPKPLSPYGVTKLAAEHLVSLYSENFGIPATSLRYFTVYGPGQRPDMAFNKFIRAALQSKEISIFGDGEQVREFTHVSDIVRANIAVLESQPAPGTIVNLSGGSSITVNQTLNVLSSVLNTSLQINYGSKVPGDVQRTGGSTSEAKRLLDWSPSIEIEDGLQSQVAWMRNLPQSLLKSFDQGSR